MPKESDNKKSDDLPKFIFIVLSIHILFFFLFQLMAEDRRSGNLDILYPPYTKITDVSFINQKTGKTISGIDATFFWHASGHVGPYDKFNAAPDHSGTVKIPRKLKPVPVLFFPFWVRGHSGISLSIRSWQFEPENDWLNENDEKAIIKLKPLIDADSQFQALLTKSWFFEKEFWNEGINDILRNYRIKYLSSHNILQAVEDCQIHDKRTCDQFNKELLRRKINL